MEKGAQFFKNIFEKSPGTVEAPPELRSARKRADVSDARPVISPPERRSSRIHSGDESERLKTLFGQAKKIAEVFLFISTLSGIPGMVEGSTAHNDIAEALQKSRNQQHELVVKMSMERGSKHENDMPPGISEKAV